MSEQRQYAEGMYSTGEIAKKCGVTVRTVQYYDSRGILIPSELTDGGRRMYSEGDVRKLMLLTYLRKLGLSIDNICTILNEDNAENVIRTLLEEQIRQLNVDISERCEMLREASGFLSAVRGADSVDTSSLQDIAHVMRSKKKLNKVHITMLAVGIGMEIPEIATAIYGIKTGVWWPFAVCMALVIPVCILLVRYYCKNVSYICPECHSIFNAGVKEMIFSMHTPSTRKLVCPYCGKKSFCVETFREKENNDD